MSRAQEEQELDEYAAWLGGVSFPFYLNAWIGTFIFHALLKRTGWAESGFLLPVEFTLDLGIAAVAYHLIDASVMAHRREFYRPTLGWALGAIGYLFVIAAVAVYLWKVH